MSDKDSVSLPDRPELLVRLQCEFKQVLYSEGQKFESLTGQSPC